MWYLLVCEKFAQIPEFRVGNFAVNLKCEISHAKLKCHDPPPLYMPMNNFFSQVREHAGTPTSGGW